MISEQSDKNGSCIPDTGIVLISLACSKFRCSKINDLFTNTLALNCKFTYGVETS